MTSFLIDSFAVTRRIVAELIGTTILLAAVVGSGIAGERLANGNAAITLLANTLATGAILVALIFAFISISGSHFNPAVTLSAAWHGDLPWRHVPAYIIAQVVGAFAGVALAHLMFGLPVFSASQHVRSGGGQMLGEFVAAFGLLATIWGCLRYRPQAIAYAVAAFIMAGYWFTSSTSFANPAVTMARSMTDTFTGIRFLDVPLFILAQLLGAFASTALFRWFDVEEK